MSVIRCQIRPFRDVWKVERCSTNKSPCLHVSLGMINKVWYTLIEARPLPCFDRISTFNWVVSLTRFTRNLFSLFSVRYVCVVFLLSLLCSRLICMVCVLLNINTMNTPVILYFLKITQFGLPTPRVFVVYFLFVSYWVTVIKIN